MQWRRGLAACRLLQVTHRLAVLGGSRSSLQARQVLGTQATELALGRRRVLCRSLGREAAAGREAAVGRRSSQALAAPGTAAQGPDHPHPVTRQGRRQRCHLTCGLRLSTMGIMVTRIIMLIITIIISDQTLRHRCLEAGDQMCGHLAFQQKTQIGGQMAARATPARHSSGLRHQKEKEKARGFGGRPQRRRKMMVCRHRRRRRSLQPGRAGRSDRI